jgi:hypothetical protein
MAKHPAQCAFWRFEKDSACPNAAFYLLELLSREGPRCQTAVCREHVHHAWAFGQRVLARRFGSRRRLRLAAIRLMPLPQKAIEARDKAAGAE